MNVSEQWLFEAKLIMGCSRQTSRICFACKWNLFSVHQAQLQFCGANCSDSKVALIPQSS